MQVGIAAPHGHGDFNQRVEAFYRLRRMIAFRFKAQPVLSRLQGRFRQHFLRQEIRTPAIAVSLMHRERSPLARCSGLLQMNHNTGRRQAERRVEHVG